MPTAINLGKGFGAIHVPPGWQKPCKAGQWSDGVLAASTSISLPSGQRWDVYDVPAGLAPDGAGGVFVLTKCTPDRSPDGPFALRPISATGRTRGAG
jgi:hypothetical protein